MRIYDTEIANRELPNATTLEDVIAVIRRQAKPLLICAFAGIGIGVAHHVTTPKQYYASATVLVDERPNQLPEEINTSTPYVRNDTSLLNEIQILKSLELATVVVEKTNLQENDVFRSPPSSLARDIISSASSAIKSVISREEDVDPTTETDPEVLERKRIMDTASKLQRNIGIERNGLSFSINISYLGHDPELSALLVNTYADSYLADHLNANLESTERTAEWMNNRLAELQQRSADVTKEAEELRASDPSQVLELRELAQQAANLDEFYQTISNRYEQVAIQGSFPVSNGRVLTRSVLPTNPATPKLFQTVALATILGLMLGFAIAVWRETRERSFRVAWDVFHYTGQRFLGHLPRIQLASVKAKLPTSVKAFSPELFWSVLAPESEYHDTLSNIHVDLNASVSRTGCKVIGVGSMSTGEGKTTIAANYANMLAKSGVRTLLIDMDIDNSGLSRALRYADGHGVLGVLRGDDPLSEAIQKVEFTGLEVLPCAATDRETFSADVRYQKNLAALLTELRNHYEFVLVDMPALCNGSNAKAISACLDKIVLACEWGKTPRSLVTQYLAQEPEVSRKILGIALNNVETGKLSKYARQGSPETYQRKQRQLI